MNDNFDLRKFLVESKAIENMNPIFRKLNENKENTTAETTETPEATTTEPLTENTLRAKIREMVLAELEGGEDYDLESRKQEYGINPEIDDLYSIEDEELFEAKKKEEDVEDMPAEDTEIDIELDAEPTTPEDELNMAAAGATGDSKEMIDHLMKALDNAKASGNEKLVTQVLNTLKFAIDQSIVD